MIYTKDEAEHCRKELLKKTAEMIYRHFGKRVPYENPEKCENCGREFIERACLNTRNIIDKTKASDMNVVVRETLERLEKMFIILSKDELDFTKENHIQAFQMIYGFWILHSELLGIPWTSLIEKGIAPE